MSLIAAQNEITRWTRQADELAEQGDWQALGDGLDRIRALRRQLSVLERHVEDHVATLMPSKRVEIPGLGMERRTSTSRTEWQTDGLLGELLYQTRADESGEIHEEGHAGRLLEAIKQCASFSWKVTGLRARGFEIDEWCREGEPKQTVQVWRPEEQA